MVDTVILNICRFKLFPAEEIEKYRFISRSWRQAIENNYPRITFVKHLYVELNHLFYYNKSEYDQFYYLRKLKERELKKNYHLYKKLRNFKISHCLLNIDNEQYHQTFLKNIRMPLEFYAFLKIYQKFPQPFIHLFSPEIMEIFLQEQYSVVEELMYFDESKLIIFIPFFWINHFCDFESDSKAISIVFYINILNSSRTQVKKEKKKFIIKKFKKADSDFLNIINTLKNKIIHYASSQKAKHIAINQLNSTVDLITAINTVIDF